MGGGNQHWPRIQNLGGEKKKVLVKKTIPKKTPDLNAKSGEKGGVGFAIWSGAGGNIKIHTMKRTKRKETRSHYEFTSWTKKREKEEDFNPNLTRISGKGKVWKAAP